MKTLIKILKYIAYAIVGIALMLGGLIWYWKTDKLDTIYIPKVDFKAQKFNIDKEYSKEEQMNAQFEFESLTEPFFMSNYHWLKDGDKYAILLRAYSDPILLAVDDELFSQITVVTPSLEIGEYPIDGEKIRAFYTRGASAWPDSQCGAPINNGKIAILSKSPEVVEAKIEFSVNCKEIRGNTTKTTNFNQEFSFKEFPFDRASAWYGKKGKHIYDETYRRLKIESKSL